MGLRRVVLWDIDHTLIDTRGVGRKLSGIAFEQVTGLRMEQQARIDGITEPVIFRETAKLHGLETGRRDFERFAQALAEATCSTQPNYGNAATPCPARQQPWTPWPRCRVWRRPW
ncbi:hypothetical protein ACMATS_32595 [Streptoverticillium reticulum]|uniref:hypothetical protein n=1 Tax=Streptoverticillium reticulum TaxID=1433415 RepID=UPI0039BF4984